MKSWFQHDRVFAALLFLIVPATVLMACDLLVGLGNRPMALIRMTFEGGIIGCFLTSLSLRRSGPKREPVKTTQKPRL